MSWCTGVSFPKSNAFVGRVQSITPKSMYILRSSFEDLSFARRLVTRRVEVPVASVTFHIPRTEFSSRVDFSTHFWMVFDPTSCSIKPLKFSGCDSDSLRISWHFHGYKYHSEPWLVSPALECAAAWWPYKMPTCRRKMMATRKITMAISSGTNLFFFGDRQQPTIGQSGEAETTGLPKSSESSVEQFDKVRPRYFCWFL